MKSQIRPVVLAVCAALSAPGFASPAAAQQIVDQGFTPHVAHPAWTSDGPEVVIDEAHRNFHTAVGRYGPFAALLRADGFRVARGTTAFSDDGLKEVKLLVIANAGSADGRDTTEPAFTEAETAAVEHWVSAGGSLLLIADHAPFGTAARGLAERFGVGMGAGFAFHPEGRAVNPQLEFSRMGRTLGDHPILNGRSSAERVETVRSFTGQSLIAPADATPLLILRREDRETPDRATLQTLRRRLNDGEGSDTVLNALSVPVGDRVQGLALTHGAGRVVVLGEAAMLSAQVVRSPDGSERPMGMNAPGSQDQQFALNILHWLARLD